MKRFAGSMRNGWYNEYFRASSCYGRGFLCDNNEPARGCLRVLTNVKMRGVPALVSALTFIGEGVVSAMHLASVASTSGYAASQRGEY